MFLLTKLNEIFFSFQINLKTLLCSQIALTDFVPCPMYCSCLAFRAMREVSLRLKKYSKYHSIPNSLLNLLLFSHPKLSHPNHALKHTSPSFSTSSPSPLYSPTPPYNHSNSCTTVQLKQSPGYSPSQPIWTTFKYNLPPQNLSHTITTNPPTPRRSQTSLPRSAGTFYTSLVLHNRTKPISTQAIAGTTFGARNITGLPYFDPIPSIRFAANTKKLYPPRPPSSRP